MHLDGGRRRVTVRVRNSLRCHRRNLFEFIRLDERHLEVVLREHVSRPMRLGLVVSKEDDSAAEARDRGERRPPLS